MGVAQSKEECKPFEFLLDIENINVILDYTDADIAFMDFEKFVEFQNEDYRSWSFVEKEWKSKFLKEMNEILGKKNIKVGANKDFDYSILIKFKIITANGNISCVCKVINQDGEDIGAHKYFYFIRGGVIGDMVNLMGDGHEHLGEELGRFLSIMKERLEYFKKKGTL